MMGIETIRELNNDAAHLAARMGYEPSLCEVDGALPETPIHTLGDYVPDGWEPTGAEYFVDSSGFGRDDEPALSIKQFAAACRAGYGYAVTSAGQFQVYVAEYKPV